MLPVQFYFGIIKVSGEVNGSNGIVYYRFHYNLNLLYLERRHKYGLSRPNRRKGLLRFPLCRLAVPNLFDPIFTPIELLVGFFNAFLACLSPAIVGNFLFLASQGQTDTFACGAFGPQKQGPKVSLYPFALHLTAQNLTLCKTKN